MFVLFYISIISVCLLKLRYIIGQPNLLDTQITSFPSDCESLNQQNNLTTVTYCSLVSIKYEKQQNQSFICEGYNSKWQYNGSSPDFVSVPTSIYEKDSSNHIPTFSYENSTREDFKIHKLSNIFNNS